MAGLTAAAVRLAVTFPTDGTSLGKGSEAGITVLLLAATLLSNVCGVKVCIHPRKQRSKKSANFVQLYGNLERVFKLFKISLLLFLFIFMIAINLDRKFIINILPSFRESSNIGASWRSKDRIKDWKYVVLNFNKIFWLT
jgi:hypothetical protein